MDMFNVKRRDNPSMDRWTNLKKPAFGGPSEKEDFDKSKKKALDKYQRVVERDPNAEGGRFNPNYDSAWKAFSSDIVYKSAKKNEVVLTSKQYYSKQTESLNELDLSGRKNLVIFDIDDTLMHTTAQIKVVDKTGKVLRSLTNQEFNQIGRAHV